MGQAGWDGEFPSVRDHFARVLAPDATPEEQRVCAEAMHACIDRDAFGRLRHVVGHIDVTGLLPRIACPALFLHAAGDRLQPVEQSRRLAAGIPGARFIALPSRNHVLPPHDPALPVALREIDGFLSALD